MHTGNPMDEVDETNDVDDDLIELDAQALGQVSGGYPPTPC